VRRDVQSKPPPEVCSWYDGPTLFALLDSTDAPPRNPMASFRMPVMDKFKDMGTVVMGKSESGVVQARPSAHSPPLAQALAAHMCGGCSSGCVRATRRSRRQRGYGTMLGAHTTTDTRT
jgi:hypothetical protein